MAKSSSKMIRAKDALPLLAELGVVGEDGKAVSGRTLRRWCTQDCPHERKGRGRTAPTLVDPQAVAEWWLARGLAATRGRPSKVDQLLAGEGQPETQSPIGTSSRRTTGKTGDPLKLTAAERSILEARGFKADELDEIEMRPALFRRVAVQIKTRKDRADTEKRELENERARGDLHPVAACRRKRVQRIHMVRSRMRAAPGRMIQELAKRGVRSKVLEKVREVAAAELHQVQLEFCGRAEPVA